MAEIRYLQLQCTACSARFERTWEPDDGQIKCPQCSAPICPCGCGGDLAENRAGALYYSEACRKRLERANNTDTSRTGIRSGNVRSVEEAAALHDQFKAEWKVRILRRIGETLDRKGEYHADDCADLPVPAAHVNLIGTQVMRLKNAGAIVKVGTRRNTGAASNSRWSGVYRWAKGGRAKLDEMIAGDGAGNRGDGHGGSAGQSAEVAFPSAPPASAVAGDENSSGREAVKSSAASRPGENVGAGQMQGESHQGRRDSSPAAGTDTPEPSVAEELASAEGQLFGSEPVAMSSNSAFNPENEFA